MRLTRLSEGVSAGRSAWACWLAAATITTSEAPTTLNLPQGSIRYLLAGLVHRRRERSLDPAAWMYGNTSFTAIATALWAAPTTSWARGRWLISEDYSLTSWIMVTTGSIRQALVHLQVRPQRQMTARWITPT